MRLLLNVPVAERTAQWSEEQTRTIGQMALMEVRARKKDTICFMYYNGLTKQEDFQYLTDVGDKVYPARVRFYEIIRPKIDMQLSKLTRRPLAYKAIASDTESKKEKLDTKLKDYFNLFDVRIQVAKTQSLQKIQAMKEQLDQIDQALQQQPQSEEDVAMFQELKMIRPQVEMALVALQTSENNTILLNEEEEEKIENYHKYNSDHYTEKGAQAYMKEAIIQKGIMQKSLKAFRNQWVTGKPIYFVDVNTSAKYPDFEVLNPAYVAWSGGNLSELIHDQDWASYTVTMTSGQIYSRFSLTKEQQGRLDAWAGYSNTNFNTNYSNDAIDAYQSEKKFASSRLDKLIDVTYVYWRSPRKLTRKFSPNKNVPGAYFSHIIEEDTPTLSDGEKIEITYIDDIWEGVLIGANSEGMVVNNQMRKHQVDHVDTFKRDLPIIGRSFNDPSDEPHSAIWSTKDIQDLYNILRFQQELLVVISGVKGIILDKAQMPDMPEEDWLYDRKMGITWIDSLKKTLGKLPSFNQFQTYDDTLSQSVLYIDEMCIRLDELAGTIIGVSRQAVGQTVGTDQVGTNRMSIEQSSLINEISFYEHYDLLGHALSRFMNCAKEQGLTDEIVSSVSSDMGQSLMKLPKDIFSGKYWEILIANNSNESQAIDTLRSMANNERNRGTLSMTDMIKVYKAETLNELEETLIFAGKIAMKQAQQQQQGMQQGENEQAMQLKQLDIQQQQASDKMKSELEQMKMQIMDKQITMQQMQADSKMQLEREKMQADNYLRSQDMAVKALQVQKAYENDNFKNRISAIQQKVDALLGQRKLEIESIKAHKTNSSKA